jgi:ferredoxin-type protein NapH
MLAHKHIITNLVIGTLTVATIWMLLGGRTFCSWVCPYHFVAEWAEKLHLWLAAKKLVTDQAMNRGLRSVFWLASSRWRRWPPATRCSRPSRPPASCRAR